MSFCVIIYINEGGMIVEAEAISKILQVYLLQSLNNQDGVSKPSSSGSFQNVLNSVMQGYSSQYNDNSVQANESSYKSSSSYNGVSKELEDVINKACEKNGLDSEAMKAIIKQGLGDNTTSFSNLGTADLMKIIPETTEDLGSDGIKEILLKLLPIYLAQGLNSDGGNGLLSSTSSSVLFESLLKSSIDGYGLQNSNDNLDTNVKSYKVSNSSNKEVSNNIEDAIEKVSKKYGVDADFIRAIIKQESGFKPNVVSKAGAMGLMQLMPKTADALGVNNPFNALENLDGGTRYIKKLMDSFEGNPVLALAAYNGGSGRMKRLGVDSAEEIQLMPKETRNYVQKVMNNYEKYKKL